MSLRDEMPCHCLPKFKGYFDLDIGNTIKAPVKELFCDVLKIWNNQGFYTFLNEKIGKIIQDQETETK